jgi:YHS domain-containing protein
MIPWLMKGKEEQQSREARINLDQRLKMILKLIIGIILIYLLYKLVNGWKTVTGPSAKNLPAAGEDLVEDPLCHTYVPVSHAYRATIEGKTLHFCSRKCLEKYTEDRRKA